MRIPSIRRTILPALVLAATLLSTHAPPAGAVILDNGKPAAAGKAVPGHYVVVFKDSVRHPHSVAGTQARGRGGHLGFVYYGLNGYSVKGLSKEDAEALRRNPKVRYVMPDYRVKVDSQEIPTGVDRVFATANNGLYIEEADNFRVDADVAVVDTGIDYEHPDLNVVGRTDCIPGDEGESSVVCNDGTGTDGYGHGTHVAGTIGALDNNEGVVGVAPGARLWGVKVLNDYGEGYYSWIIAGVEWVTAHADQIEVANMSLGGPDYPPLNEAIDASSEAGVVYVVAAGNSHKDAKYASPANDPDAITVSAVADYDGQAGGKAEALKYDCSEVSEETWGADDTRASYSNYGEDVDVAAPGTCILSTFPTGAFNLESDQTSKGYGVISGTSMAAPHVAGAAALLASQENPEDLEDVEAIRSTIEEEGNYGWEDTSGDGVKEPLLDVSDEVAFAPTDQKIVTGKAEILSTSEATLHGSLNPGGQETEYWFEYGTTAEYGSKAPISGAGAGSGSEYTSVEETLEGLEGQTLYHYRLAASNEEEAYYGNDRVFGTTPPTVSTGSATEVNANDAELDATVNPEGLATTYAIEYGPTTSYGHRAAAGSLEAGTESIEVGPKLVAGLDGEATYHFRAVATNMAGTSTGEDATFTTPPADWVAQTTPDPHKEEEEEKDVTHVKRGLWQVSCSTVSDCMAIGFTVIEHEESPATRYPEALRWDGTSWTHYDLPVPEGIERDDTFMHAVSCAAPDSCFALGKDGFVPDGKEAHIFVNHWDGEKWTAQLMPMPGNISAGIEGVSCGSPDSCMAATYYSTAETPLGVNWPVIQVWDGEEWSIVSSPTPPEGRSQAYVRAVSCPTANACIVTGGNGWAASWDGESWSEEAIPFPAEPALAWISFDGLSCTSAEACVAVGIGRETETGSETLFAAHWNGEKWAVEPMPEPPDAAVLGDTDHKVSCWSADDCEFAVVVVSSHAAGEFVLAERWDGEQWTIQTAASPTWPFSDVWGLSCVQGHCTLVASGGQTVQRLRSSPIATTEPATEIGAAAATLNATVNAEGLETSYQFEYVEQGEFEQDGYENATSVPVSTEAIGSGTSNVGVSQEITGLAGGRKYHFRVKATNEDGTAYGEDETLRTGGPALEPPGGSFPASFSLAGAQTVSLVGPEITISCTTSGEVKALGGEGQFEDATSGTATLTLHNCKGPFNVNCTTSGQAAGTIKTEALPFRLAYLSDGEPGIVFLPNEESGLLAAVKCSVLWEVKLKGSGVLGRITEPGLDEPSPTLTIDLNAPEGEQQYTETEAEEQYALQMSLNGAALEPAALEAEALASFGEGEGTLVGSGTPALQPSEGSFPASFSLAGAQTVSLVSPEITITCTTSGEVKALGGEGQFEDATSGTATLTLRNCKGPFGVKCTTSGQTAGTIKTEALPFRLAYLSDGEPGIVFLPNEESGLLAAVKCSVIAEVKLKGSGVLGQITEPALGEPSPTLTIDLNAPEGEQQYTETEAEEQYALQMSLNGAALEPAALDAEAVASFGEGEGTLVEG